MVSFEIFVKSMLPSLSELKVLPSFCFAFKIPDDVAVTTEYHSLTKIILGDMKLKFNEAPKFLSSGVTKSF